MHFSTSSAKPGDRAFLESRWLYPKPGAQCLQFFLHNTGTPDDVLNIWVREYDKVNPGGKLKLFKSISGNKLNILMSLNNSSSMLRHFKAASHFTGGVMGSWELHHINLNVTQKARVVFEGVRGSRTSKGGFSLDDINLSSTRCPQHIWHIRNITKLLATTQVGGKMYSPRFLSPAGYSFQVNGSSNVIINIPALFVQIDLMPRKCSA